MKRWQKRLLQGLGGLALGLGLLAWQFDPSWILTPGRPFDPAQVPAAPDYREDSAWAALPWTIDGADVLAPGESHAPDPAVDVFYLHPTTLFSKAYWNGPIDEPVSRELLDEVVLAAEASIFNGVGRVFAPRYRQGTLGLFYGAQSDAQAALSVAYADIERAFAVFLEHSGDRPFVVAGHSQGSLHMLRLLEQIEADEEVRGRMVAAYAVGIAIPLEGLATPPCERPGQTGCVLGWDTYREGATVGGQKPLWHWRGDELVRIDADAPRLCVNPVSGVRDGAAPASAHGPAGPPIHTTEAPSFSDLLMASEPLGLSLSGIARMPLALPTRCEDSVLRVPEPADYPLQPTEPGNYHLHDFEFFRENVRADVARRVGRFRNG